MFTYDLPEALPALASAFVAEPEPPVVLPWQRAERLVRVQFEVSESIDLGGVTAALDKVGSLQKELDLWQSTVPGYNKGVVQGAIFEGISTGEISEETLSDLQSMIFTTGGTIACAAATSGALAPLCATAVSFVVGLLGGALSSQKVAMTPKPEAAHYDNAIAADKVRILAAREKLRSEIVFKLRFDETARSEAFAIIDEFYPVWMLSNDGSQNPLYLSDNKASPATKLDLYEKKIMQSAMAPGFFAPFLDRCILRDNFSTACLQPNLGPYYSDDLYEFIPLPTDPEWVWKYLAVMGGIFKHHGVDMMTAVSTLNEWGATQGRYGGGPFVQHLQVIEDIKLFLFPLIEEELQRRLAIVYMNAAARVTQKVLDATNALADEIAAQVGCDGPNVNYVKCRDAFVPFASEIVLHYDELGPDEASRRIAEAIADARAYYQAKADEINKLGDADLWSWIACLLKGSGYDPKTHTCFPLEPAWPKDAIACMKKGLVYDPIKNACGTTKISSACPYPGIPLPGTNSLGCPPPDVAKKLVNCAITGGWFNPFTGKCSCPEGQDFGPDWRCHPKDELACTAAGGIFHPETGKCEPAVHDSSEEGGSSDNGTSSASGTSGGLLIGALALAATVAAVIAWRHSAPPAEAA